MAAELRARAAAAALLLPLAAVAQVRTDASLGRPAATLPGPTYAIPQAIGRTAGNNLFHSFQSFSVGYGEVAVFSMAPTIANVVARVTGGEASFIRGTLRVEAGGGRPDFWLLNPAGVVFGGGAQLDVPGAFHVTTANYLRFADGEFHADAARTSTFSSLAPEAFGFLGATRAEVRLENGAEVRNRGAIDVVAGDFSATRAELRGGRSEVRIVAFGGGAGEVPVSGPVSGAEGSVTITAGGRVRTQASSSRGGDIVVDAGNLTLDGSGSDAITGISATTAGPAPSGDIVVTLSGSGTISNGASVLTRTDGAGRAGDIAVRARDLTIDGKGADDTGVLSLAALGSTGRAGDVKVELGGALALFEGGVISSDTASSGGAGSVAVSAESILLDGRAGGAFTGISSDTREETSSGSAGSVDVRARAGLTLVSGSEISSTSNGTGDAGHVTVRAGTLLIDSTADQENITGIHSSAFGAERGNAGNVEVRVDGSARITGGGEITADTWTSGHGGNVLVTASDLVIDGTGYPGFTGISTDAVAGTGSAGSLEVRANTISLIHGGSISSDTLTTGNAGSVHVVAGALTVEGRMPGSDSPSSISSRTFDESGAAGNVRVEVDGLLSVADGGVISSSTFTSGNAGAVTVTAGSLLLDGRDVTRAVTGFTSQANEGTGNAGAVVVEVRSDARILGGAVITSSTFSPGSAGEVRLHVGGNLEITGAEHDWSGVISNSWSGGGPAGNIDVAVDGRLTLSRGAAIESDTASLSPAGSVRVRAGSLRIEGAAGKFTGISTDSRSGSRGSAGDVTVDVAGDAEITQGGVIASSTRSPGDAGTVIVRAGNLAIDGSGTAEATGISTSSLLADSGHAGRVEVAVDGDLSLRAGGSITSATASRVGRAGTVDIHGARIAVDGAFNGVPSQVSARSLAGASGHAGDITIGATESIVISHGGQVSIGNDSTAADPAAIAPSRLSLAAPRIAVTSGGSVTAQSSGNVSASDIAVAARDLLALDSGSITTSANLGNGGEIAIDAGTVSLANAQVTTSVLGTVGNGGDIRVRADVLRMETGFIQANTAAPDASGGNVAIDTRTLVATGSNVFVGGSTPIAFAPGVFALNVIQAAAPTGVSGTIDITSPVLDTSGTLPGLGAAPLDTSLLGRSPCRVGAGSSLALAGRGGLAPSAREAFRLDPPLFASGAYDPRRIAATGTPCPRAHAAS